MLPLSQLSVIDRIKLVMLVAMTIGHIAWAFVPIETRLSDMLHFIARITIPLACFLVVVGYQKTKDIYGYIARLLGFAVLAQIPFIMSEIGLTNLMAMPIFVLYYGNVLFSLAFGLMAVMLANGRYLAGHLNNPVVRAIGVLVLLRLSMWSDWSFAVVLWVLAIYYRGTMGFVVVTVGLFLLSLVASKDSALIIVRADNVMDYGLFLAVPMMVWYEYTTHRPVVYRLPRLLFYWYYVGHLLVIGVGVSLLGSRV